MHKKTKALIIYGTGETADIAYEYFTNDSPYEVIGFAMDEAFIQDKLHNGLPVFNFENIETLYSPKDFEFFVGTSYGKLNRDRMKMYEAVKLKGYRCASYVSTSAFVWHNVKIGENTMILEHTVLQHKASVGNNVIIWGGCYIGHQSKIKDHVFLAPRVAIPGFCEIGEFSFMAVNSAVNDFVKIAKDNFIASGAVVTKDTASGFLMKGVPAQADKKTAYDIFNISPKVAEFI
jgi:sugar O-acyltransferase (sialic acid O-acetyltransferase NeuD family)